MDEASESLQGNVQEQQNETEGAGGQQEGPESGENDVSNPNQRTPSRSDDGTQYPGSSGLEDPTYSAGGSCMESNSIDSTCYDVLAEGDTCVGESRYHDDGRLVVPCAPYAEQVAEEDDQEQPDPVERARSAFMEMTLEAPDVKFEPDLLGFGYEGRHTNMFADVDVQQSSQELLGRTMELRAIPVSYYWTYGDGTSRMTYEPGDPLPDYDGTGEEINAMDFKTPTSHVYEETGIFEVTVTTEFVGQFRYDGGDWDGIPGTISVTSSPGEADIWTQNSRWVSGACESQDQWGCNGPVQFDPSTDRPPKIYQDQYDENGNWIGPAN